MAKILDVHYTKGVMGELQDAGTITITGTTSNPTKGTTSLDKMRWRRMGDRMEISIEFIQIVSGLAGSGDYMVDIPAGYMIDTTKLVADNIVEGGNSSLSLSNSVGIVNINNATNGAVGVVFVHDATKVRFGVAAVTSTGTSNSTGAWGSTFFALTETDVNLVANFSVPIVGWLATK